MEASISGMKSNVPRYKVPNIICPKYIVVSYDNRTAVQSPLIDQRINRATIEVRNHGYTDAEVFKTAMSGVYLVYELAEETAEIADPYINPQRSEGTEEFVDGLTRDVMVPVGNESTYFMSEVIPIISEYIDAVTSS
jgi:hypothetical protein